MQNELISIKERGERVTATASANVVGKRMVSVSGEPGADGTYTVAPTAADGVPFGAACWDALTGKRVTVVTVQSGHIVPLTAGDVIAAGDSVKVGAEGIVPAAAEAACGIAVAGAAAGDDVAVLLTYHTAA